MLDRCTFGLFTENRDLTRSDATDRVRKRFRKQVRWQMQLQGKRRFITKYTGVPRTDFVREIFPDARFIHVYRDGRSVANSFLNVDWWPQDETGWWYGEMPAEVRERYEASGRSPVVLAGLVWSTLVTAIDQELKAMPENQTLSIRYDELIRDPVATLQRATDFCGLNRSDDFENHVRSIRVNDRDNKWKHDLTPEQQRLLEGTIEETLRCFNY